jgi:hypothetical protein
MGGTRLISVWAVYSWPFHRMSSVYALPTLPRSVLILVVARLRFLEYLAAALTVGNGYGGPLRPGRGGIVEIRRRGRQADRVRAGLVGDPAVHGQQGLPFVEFYVHHVFAAGQSRQQQQHRPKRIIFFFFMVFVNFMGVPWHSPILTT